MNTPNLVNDTLLHMTYARIIDLLATELGITHPHALEVCYETDTYRYLSKKMYHLHNKSDAYLVDEIMLELQRKQQ